MELDRNWHPIPLLSNEIPLAVTRFTTSLVSAQDIVTTNANTKLVRLYADSYDAYIYFYAADRTATVTTSVFHAFVPAGQFVDRLVPANTTKITGIAEWACPKFIVEEYA